MTIDAVVERYRQVFEVVVGPIPKESDMPVPWFTYNIWNKLQWSGYVGDCQGASGLGFGLNLEFTPTWRKVRPHLQIDTLSRALHSVSKDEWHWEGRPGFLCKNPGVRPLYPHQPVDRINLAHWIDDLDGILSRAVMWDHRPMRPQLQIMRRVGDCRYEQDWDVVVHNVQLAMRDMQPLVDLMRGKR